MSVKIGGNGKKWKRTYYLPTYTLDSYTFGEDYMGYI